MRHYEDVDARALLDAAYDEGFTESLENTLRVMTPDERVALIVLLTRPYHFSVEGCGYADPNCQCTRERF